MNSRAVDPDLAELLRFWRKLDEDGRYQVLWMARSAAAAHAAGVPRMSALVPELRWILELKGAQRI